MDSDQARQDRDQNFKLCQHDRSPLVISTSNLVQTAVKLSYQFHLVDQEAALIVVLAHNLVNLNSLDNQISPVNLDSLDNHFNPANQDNQKTVISSLLNQHN